MQSPIRAGQGPDVAAWMIVILLLFVAVQFRLWPVLFAGLLVFQLVHVITPKLPLVLASSKAAAVAILTAAIVALLLLIFFGVLAFFRSETAGFDPLVQKIAQIIESSRDRLPEWMDMSLPDDADGIKTGSAAWLRSHASAVGLIGRHALEGVIHVIIGMVIGGMLALREALPDKQHGPLAMALIERGIRFADAFGRIVFAQVRIAALNTAFTAIYIAVLLPLFGIHLPLKTTLIAITFIAGLLPVLGNLISNTLIVIASLSISPHLALLSLGFLILIHKLEYFLNARIVGRSIEADPWELLMAMVVMEAVFGVAGLICAPVYYAYMKYELAARKLI